MGIPLSELKALTADDLESAFAVKVNGGDSLKSLPPFFPGDRTTLIHRL